jgi:signal transduction histidine kinase
MRLAEVEFFSIGPRLMLLFAVLIALILGGNSLLVWQFHIASLQTRRLAGANQQVVAVLRLQGTLLSFHLRLDDLERSRNADALATEAEPLRSTLVEQLQRVRRDLTHLPSETRVDPTLLPSLDAIQATLQSELEAITKLATSGDWVAVRLRLSSELKPLEAHTSALVKRTDDEVTEELTQTDANMRNVRSTIIILVPAMAVCTFLIAASFGWATARRIIELRVEERVNERTRIARELHDTLLQSFHGLLLRFQTASELFPTRPAKAKQTLDSAIEQAAQAITEGRDAVQGLRSSTVVTNDLTLAINTLGEELAGGETNPNAAEFHVGVEGTPRDLHPILRDEVYRIAGEALRNAFKHAQAHQIEVEIRYDERQFRLRVRDDGKGIDSKLLNDDERPGHYGMRGMRERAKLLGGKLTVWSEVETGTEVELSIPAARAYATAEGRRRSWLAEKFEGRLVEKDTERKS